MFNYLSNNIKDIDIVVDIGCGDGYLRDFINKNITYIGIDNDPFMISLCKKKYKDNFYCWEFNDKKLFNLISELHKNRKKILLTLIGIVHHLPDSEIEIFVNYLHDKNVKVITIDPLVCKNSSILSRILFKLDKGKYIRDFEGYQNILKSFNYIIFDDFLKFKHHTIIFKSGFTN